MKRIAASRRSRLGATLSVVLGGLALATAVTIGVISLPSPHSSPLMLPATNQELAVTLSRLRLNPEPLAAAGLTAQQTTSLVSNLRSHLSTHMDAIRLADTELGNASNTVDALTRRIRAGLGSEQDVSQLASATTALNTARSSLNSLLAAAYSAATDGLGQNALSGIATSRGNLDGVAGDSGVGGIPTQYLFSSRSETTWVNLRDALANVRISGRHNQDPNPDAQSLISSLNAEPATATAIANLNNNLSTVTAAWNNAVFPQ